MAGKREATRRDLTQRLLIAATERIAANGLVGLRARDVTADARCGLGTIYKCYRDLDDLILHVNAVTLSRLDQALTEATADIPDPTDRLVHLALAYLAFARGNLNLWAALFDHRMADGSPLPAERIAERDRLFQHVEGPLARLFPQLSGPALVTRARTIFSAAHGVVTLNVLGRIPGVEDASVESELEALVRAMVRGFSPDPLT